MDINERDWKLFRKYLPDWQENYMEKLIKDYIEFLNADFINHRLNDKLVPKCNNYYCGYEII